MSREYAMVATDDAFVISWFETILPFLMDRHRGWYATLNNKQKYTLASREFRRFIVSGSNLFRCMLDEPQIDVTDLEEAPDGLPST